MASEQPSPSLREDLVANAVGFLSNPKVRASAEGPKRQFLENKGLTTAEIDEAFRRVPNDLPAPSPPTTSATAPAKPFHTAVVPTQQQQLQPVPQGIRWSQVVIGATLLAAGAYTVHSLLWPRAHQLYQRWTSSWREAQQQQEQRAAANAKMVADALEAQSAELRSTVSSLRDLISELRETRSGQASSTIQELRDELRSISAAVNEHHAGYTHSPDSMNGVPRWTTVSYSDHNNNNNNTAEAPVSSNQAPPPAGPDPPHPAQFMEVLEMLSRGETPANVRTDIADTPPDPMSSPTQGRITPRPKPWERPVDQQQPAKTSSNNSASPLREQVSNTQAWRPPPLPQPYNTVAPGPAEASG